MGNDGGTIAKRQDILSLHSQGIRDALSHGIEAVEDKESTMLTTCAISSLPLYNNNEELPVVGDYKGKLFLKEKILEYLIAKRIAKNDVNKRFEHINTMNDLLELKLTWKEHEGNQMLECPITLGVKIRGMVFAYPRTCGCVMSYKVLAKLLEQSEGSKIYCPCCNKPMPLKHSIVIINPMENSEYSEINNESYEYTKNHLKLTHSMKPIKHKKRLKNQSDKKSETNVSNPKKQKTTT
ncbi:uncharacterized protein PRCAT00005110001 [Priceomyces carsonii]|uniref:uncharacterized protein n=1 Tax=Priceomyces carsonii TaxID=28549 RepID=UPI002ED98DD3|nr:unnamed protein product [Priceomyces carsonii]